MKANIMLDRYIDFINQHITDLTDQKLLLAVSGGVDSMVMLDLSIKAKLFIAVAHVNHDMRGSESDADEALVRDICAENGVVFHSYRLRNDEKSGNNFQAMAREVRYRWWKELCKSEGYSHILTAHHSSDSVETFLLNLTRGSGIKGLSSIPIVNQNILRPLSDSTKIEILEYAKYHKVAYREDGSNQECKYKRNIIRNKWIPFLRSEEPNIEKAIAKSVSNLSKEQALLDNLVHRVIVRNSSVNICGYQVIRLDDLIKEYNDNLAQLLYRYLSGYGFTEDNCNKCFTAEIGAEFHSMTHDILKDRNSILLRQKSKFVPCEVSINDYGTYIIDDDTRIVVSTEATLSSMALEHIGFPFTIRHKKGGDKFRPAGMNGASQKVKDFLTNQKVDKWAKQKTLVLVLGSTIAAVLPLRIAHGYEANSHHSTLHISVLHN